MVSRFPDSPDSPSKTAHFNSLRPRVCSDYFSLEDILVFWRSGAYKKYPRSYGADHRVCGDHCPTSGHSGPRTPVNDLKGTRTCHSPHPSRCPIRCHYRYNRGIRSYTPSVSTARARTCTCNHDLLDSESGTGFACPRCQGAQSPCRRQARMWTRAPSSHCMFHIGVAPRARRATASIPPQLLSRARSPEACVCRPL